MALQDLCQPVQGVLANPDTARERPVGCPRGDLDRLMGTSTARDGLFCRLRWPGRGVSGVSRQSAGQHTAKQEGCREGAVEKYTGQLQGIAAQAG